MIEGAGLARARREAARPGSASRIPEHHLARGPANLARCLGLTGADSGAVLDPDGRAWLTLPEEAPQTASPGAHPVAHPTVHSGPRVGVAGPGGDPTAHPWRFWLAGEKTVSAYRPGARPRTRP